MKILLINSPDLDRPIARDMAGGLGFDRGGRTLLPPLDLLMFGTVLRRAGHEVAVIDGQIAPAAIWSEIEAALPTPHALVATVSLPSLEEDIAFLKQLRQRFSAPCVIAGRTTLRDSALLERILRDGGCDLAIHGECDLTIETLLTGQRRAGTAWLEDGTYREEADVLERDLSPLPVPDRSLLNNQVYAYGDLGQSVTTMQTSRGCPFSCGYYCPYPLVQGKKWRSMSAARVVAEIADIAGRDDIQSILFRDATFTLDRKRTLEICAGMQALGRRLNWWCETRIDCVDDEMLTAMAAAGCKGINFGIESGDPRMLASLAKVGVDLDSIRKVRQSCRRLGILTRFLMVLGLPGENADSLAATFRLVREENPDFIGVTTITPYPGTPFHADAVENGWILSDEFHAFGGHGLNVAVPPLTADMLDFIRNAIFAVHKALQNDEEDSVLHLCTEVEQWRQSQQRNPI